MKKKYNKNNRIKTVKNQPKPQNNVVAKEDDNLVQLNSLNDICKIANSGLPTVDVFDNIYSVYPTYNESTDIEENPSISQLMIKPFIIAEKVTRDNKFPIDYTGNAMVRTSGYDGLACIYSSISKPDGDRLDDSNYITASTANSISIMVARDRFRYLFNILLLDTLQKIKLTILNIDYTRRDEIEIILNEGFSNIITKIAQFIYPIEFTNYYSIFDSETTPEKTKSIIAINSITTRIASRVISEIYNVLSILSYKYDYYVAEMFVDMTNESVLPLLNFRDGVANIIVTVVSECFNTYRMSSSAIFNPGNE